MRKQDLSFSKIAEFLSNIGAPTKTRRKKWHPEVVRQIFLDHSGCAFESDIDDKEEKALLARSTNNMTSSRSFRPSDPSTPV